MESVTIDKAMEMETPLRRRKNANLSSATSSTSSPSTTTSDTATTNDAKPTHTKDQIKNPSNLPIGRTPSGVLFPIPQTHDVLSSLFDPRLPKSHIDLLTLFLLGSQLVLFFSFSRSFGRVFFLPYFALWRLAYDAGLGYVLTKQSESKWIVKTVIKQGWMDEKKRPKVYNWIRGELSAKMGKDYDFHAVPIEYNVWILFRHFVDIILLNDFLSYVLMAFSYLSFPGPPSHSMALNVLRWLGGISLILFNLWVKMDAHRIVKDYAWYWGDAFFASLENLVFDGVFEASLFSVCSWHLEVAFVPLTVVVCAQFAPHPMYSVGYAGYYGLSLIAASEMVLFVSLAAHACQFGFLVWFENPHIERTYSERKPLAARTPLRPRSTSTTSVSTPTLTTNPLLSDPEDDDEDSTGDLGTRTPSLTEGEGTETEVSETEDEETKSTHFTEREEKKNYNRRPSMASSFRTAEFNVGAAAGREEEGPTRHDLDNRYFAKDLLVFKNFDFFRSGDLSFLLIVSYALALFLLPSTLSARSQIALAFLHAFLWRAFHSFGLGLALKAQSEQKWIVRHFLKHYHYEREGEAGEQALREWKGIYNLSLGMTYVSFTSLAWKCYTIPVDWTVGSILVRHTLGLLLIALHVWTAQSTFEVLGPFGWFYGDFFVTDYPHELYYTGIFRFLNNPERSMGGAAFFGLVLISGSKVVLCQAVVAILSHWWFLSWVENPHMQKLYGDTLRKDAGVTKTLRTVAARNPQVFNSVSRGVKEVHGTFEKVLKETEEAVEEFLNRSGPRLHNYLEGTKVLLRQSGERFVISRVASDIQSYDPSLYGLTVAPPTLLLDRPRASTSSGPLRFHLGESIRVAWKAPPNHSPKDWIGIYRLGANSSQLVTTVSSQGKWLGVVGEGEEEEHKKEGEVVFTGKTLPWAVGRYEFRYHHDGKHNVMSTAGPFEIFVEQPENADSPEAVYQTLSIIVAQTLAFDFAAIPSSTRHLLPSPALSTHPSSESATSLPMAYNTAESSSGGGGSGDEGKATVTPPDFSDPDDFAIYSELDAEHIAYAVKQAFEVDLDKEVVMAAANTTKLARRVLEARRLLGQSKSLG